MSDEGTRQESESEFKKGLVKEALAALKEFGDDPSDSQIEKAVEHALRHEPQGERKNFLRRTIYRKVKDALRRSAKADDEAYRRAYEKEMLSQAGKWPDANVVEKDGEILPRD